MNDINEFLKELKTLLEKYDASIDFTFDGDTHGIYDLGVEIHVHNNFCRINHDTYVDSSNIEDFN
jgi:hypothetical protein